MHSQTPTKFLSVTKWESKWQFSWGKKKRHKPDKWCGFIHAALGEPQPQRPFFSHSFFSFFLSFSYFSLSHPVLFLILFLSVSLSLCLFSVKCKPIWFRSVFTLSPVFHNVSPLSFTFTLLSVCAHLCVQAAGGIYPQVILAEASSLAWVSVGGLASSPSYFPAVLICDRPFHNRC